MSASSDADRYLDLKLNLTCPKCGSGGLIPLKQLDRMLFCFGCQTRYALERQGLVELPEHLVQVQVRTHSSDWTGHEAILHRRSTVFGNWLVDFAINFFGHGWGRWALAVVVVVSIGGAIALGSRSPAVKAPVEIPDSLDGRAKLFSEALARRDMGLLARLTDPSQHRALRIWLAHGKGIPKPVEDEKIDVQTKIVSTTLVSAKGDMTDVRVQLAASDGKPFVLDEHWAQRGEVWYFQPERLRSAAPQGPVRPSIRRARR